MEMKFTLAPAFLSVLRNVGASEEEYTWFQIATYMKKYMMWANRTPDPTNHVVSIADDPLSEVFGVRTFNVEEVSNLMKKHVVPVNHLESTRPKVHFQTRPIQGLKRKHLSTDEEEPSSPMFFYFPPSPCYDSNDDSIASIQAYPTDSAKNSGEGSSSDDCFTINYNIPLDDHYLEEYEIETLPSDDSLTTGTEDCDKFEIERFLHVSDSDIVCWGDQSNEECQLPHSSQEKIFNYKWKCAKCQYNNVYSSKQCEKCPEKRIFRLPEVIGRKKRSIRKLKNNLTSSQETTSTEKSLQDIRISERPVDSDIIEKPKISSLIEGNDMCIKCQNSPANAAFVHGRSAHTVCCYNCAKKFKMRKTSCPECSMTISKIVRIL